MGACDSKKACNSTFFLCPSLVVRVWVIDELAVVGVARDCKTTSLGVCGFVYDRITSFLGLAVLGEEALGVV